MELVPYIGPILGALPPVLVALFTNPISALWVVLLFIGLQQLEGHVVAPQVFGHTLRINPILVIFALLLGLQLDGIVGALIALPILSVLRETVVYLSRHLTLEPWDRSRRARAAVSAALQRPSARRRQALRRAARRCATSASSSHAGELVAVVGPNGAGKTTLLSIIAGVQRAERRQRQRRAAPREVGWAPQQAAALLEAHGAENLELFARLERVAEPDAAVARMLEQTGLAERADERVGRLSGGNRQRVNVALGAARRPARARARRAVRRARPGAARAAVGVRRRARRRAGTGVLFSTHNLGEARRHADALLVLADGRAAVRRARPPSCSRAVERRRATSSRRCVRFLARSRRRGRRA